MELRTWSSRGFRAFALAAVLAIGAGCSSTEIAAPPQSVNQAVLVSASEMAARLALNPSPLDDAGKIVLTADDGDSILFFIDTRIVSVHGEQYTTAEPVRLRGGDAWIRDDDAAAIEMTWNAAVANEPRDWLLPVPPLPRGPGKPPVRPSGGTTAANGLYGDQPTAAESRAWSVSRLGSQWRYIVIHHSATPTGSAAAFDKEHREVRHWDGLAYDFVIGNGQGSGDGQVEVGYRWRQQLRGAHAGNDVMNVQGIGICLVGDFMKTRPTPAQIRALSRLCNFLSSYCGIPRSNYRFHGDVRDTACPGKLFPRDFLTAGPGSSRYVTSSGAGRGTQ